MRTPAQQPLTEAETNAVEEALAYFLAQGDGENLLELVGRDGTLADQEELAANIESAMLKLTGRCAG